MHYEVENQIVREKTLWRESSSSSSIERQWQAEVEEQRCEWSPSERKVMGAVENYLENCADIKVDILMPWRVKSSQKMKKFVQGTS